MAGEVELLPERILTRRIGHDADGLVGAEKTDRVDLRATALSASFRDDGAGNLGWYVGAAGAADGSQIKAGVVNKTTGIASFPIGLTNQMFWTDGLVNASAVTTDATRGTLHFRNSYAGATVAGDIINGLSFSGAGSSNRRRAMIASVQDTASLPPTALAFYVNGSTVVGQDSVAERMRIASSGNVGIGSSAPTEKLFIQGTGNVNTATSNGTIGILSGVNASAGIIGTYTNHVFQIWANNAARVVIGAGGNMAPNVDNTQTLGSASNRWSVVYAGTGTINTSDAREKTAVRPFAAAEIAAARDLLAEIGIFQWLASIEEKGEDEARLHVGMTVQRAIAIMEGHGLDPWRYGFICRDEITRKVKVMQTQTVQATEDVEEVYTEIEVRDGVPVQVAKTRTVKRPLVEMVAVIDEAGEPVMQGDEPTLHPVPVTVEEECEAEIDEPAGERLGFRYDQLTLFILRGLL